MTSTCRQKELRARREAAARAAESRLGAVVDHNRRKFDEAHAQIEAGLNDVYRKLGLPEPYPELDRP